MSDIKSIFQKNFIGIEELQSISAIKFNWNHPVPQIPFTAEQISNCADTHLLILSYPHLLSDELISISYLKCIFKELFYFQDWYEKEPFVNCPLDMGWYLIPRRISDSSRGKLPNSQKLYNATLLTYVFIIRYITSGEVLWPYDYIWCDDTDSNGDRIYVGRYFDPLKINKDGFSIHRHLSIKKNYGWL